jgi:hypothetical protein
MGDVRADFLGYPAKASSLLFVPRCHCQGMGRCRLAGWVDDLVDNHVVAGVSKKSDIRRSSDVLATGQAIAVVDHQDSHFLRVLLPAANYAIRPRLAGYRQPGNRFAHYIPIGAVPRPDRKDGTGSRSPSTTWAERPERRILYANITRQIAGS